MRYTYAVFFVGIVACALALAIQGTALAEQTGANPASAVSASPGDVVIQPATASVFTVSRRGGHRHGRAWRGGHRRGFYGWRGGWSPWYYGQYYPSYNWTDQGLYRRCYYDEWGDRVCYWSPSRYWKY